MTFVEKHRFAGTRTEKAMLKIAWEGEIFGVGLFEALAERFPEHADILTACATMEWVNTHILEDFGHDAGLHVSVKAAEELGRAGIEFGRHSGSFKDIARITIVETAEADEIYEAIAEGAGTPELEDLGKKLVEHENALRAWMRSELDGKSNGGEEIFAYLKSRGVSKEAAIVPRKRRDSIGGEHQYIVLASFPDEGAADEAANILKNWEKASDHMKVDGIGVLVKDSHGRIKEHKLGKTAGKKGLGVGVVLGLIAAIPTAGLSLAAGAVAGGIIGHFFHKGVKLPDENAAHIHDDLDDGRAMVGILAWDTETQAVTEKLAELGAKTTRTIDLEPAFLEAGKSV